MHNYVNWQANNIFKLVFQRQLICCCENCFFALRTPCKTKPSFICTVDSVCVLKIRPPPNETNRNHTIYQIAHAFCCPCSVAPSSSGSSSIMNFFCSSHHVVRSSPSSAPSSFALRTCIPHHKISSMKCMSPNFDRSLHTKSLTC